VAQIKSRNFREQLVWVVQSMALVLHTGHCWQSCDLYCAITNKAARHIKAKINDVVPPALNRLKMRKRKKVLKHR